MAKVEDKNGFWFIEHNPITKTGVYDYLGKQISPECEPNKIYKVLRPKEELFKKETLDSLRLIPIVNDHTMIGTGFTAPEDKGIDGTLGDNVSHDTDTIYNDLKIMSNSMKEDIRNGKKELSLGYFCRYDKQPGTYKGQRYDYIQRDIKANHLALVDKGRMGADVRVYDSKQGGTFAMDSIDISLDKEFNESDVNRDDRGRFASKGSSFNSTEKYGQAKHKEYESELNKLKNTEGVETKEIFQSGEKATAFYKDGKHIATANHTKREIYRDKEGNEEAGEGIPTYKDFIENEIWETPLPEGEKEQYKKFVKELAPNIYKALYSNNEWTGETVQELYKQWKEGKWKGEDRPKSEAEWLSKLRLEHADKISADSDEDIEWITVRGTHIPIKKGESKEQAVKNFLEGKKQSSGNNEIKKHKSGLSSQKVARFRELLNKKDTETIEKEFGKKIWSENAIEQLKSSLSLKYDKGSKDPNLPDFEYLKEDNEQSGSKAEPEKSEWDKERDKENERHEKLMIKLKKEIEDATDPQEKRDLIEHRRGMIKEHNRRLDRIFEDEEKSEPERKEQNPFEKTLSKTGFKKDDNNYSYTKEYTDGTTISVHSEKNDDSGKFYIADIVDKNGNMSQKEYHYQGIEDVFNKLNKEYEKSEPEQAGKISQKEKELYQNIVRKWKQNKTPENEKIMTEAKMHLMKNRGISAHEIAEMGKEVFWEDKGEDSKDINTAKGMKINVNGKIKNIKIEMGINNNEPQGCTYEILETIEKGRDDDGNFIVEEDDYKKLEKLEKELKKNNKFSFKLNTGSLDEIYRKVKEANMEYKTIQGEGKMADKKEKVAIDEDKRKIIDEIGGILKDAGLDDELIRTVIGKAEKLAYNASEAGKGTDEGEEVEEVIEEKEEKAGKDCGKKAAKDKCGKDKDEEEVEEKEDVVNKVVEKKGMDENDVIKVIARKDRLAKAVAKVIGTFDHSEMTEQQVAEYACDKLDLPVKKGEEITGINCYLKSLPKERVIFSYGMDSASKEDAEFEKFQKGE